MHRTLQILMQFWMINPFSDYNNFKYCDVELLISIIFLVTNLFAIACFGVFFVWFFVVVVGFFLVFTYKFSVLKVAN